MFALSIVSCSKGKKGNNPPYTPLAPFGPTSGKINFTYTFKATATDIFDWGDVNMMNL
ncbi:MAG: hypothetical protein ABIL52_02615 [candidate division WOR-3 bacterium]